MENPRRVKGLNIPKSQKIWGWEGAPVTRSRWVGMASASLILGDLHPKNQPPVPLRGHSEPRIYCGTPKSAPKSPPPRGVHLRPEKTQQFPTFLL